MALTLDSDTDVAVLNLFCFAFQKNALKVPKIAAVYNFITNLVLTW